APVDRRSRRGVPCRSAPSPRPGSSTRRTTDIVHSIGRRRRRTLCSDARCGRGPLVAPYLQGVAVEWMVGAPTGGQGDAEPERPQPDEKRSSATSGGADDEDGGGGVVADLRSEERRVGHE